MRKLMTFEHLDTGKEMKVEFELVEEDGHWAAKFRSIEEEAQDEVKAPVFYGTSSEQAERQLRKVFEKDYELKSEEALS